MQKINNGPGRHITTVERISRTMHLKPKRLWCNNLACHWCYVFPLSNATDVMTLRMIEKDNLVAGRPLSIGTTL
ncbi:MAG: hypothetical protein ACJ74Z_12920 [Bryobacteraceae bacterium]